MKITENLFLSISDAIGFRVTPDTLRSKMKDISGVGGITNKVKTDIITELALAIADLEKKINDK